jgi:hypothetical protein
MQPEERLLISTVTKQMLLNTRKERQRTGAEMENNRKAREDCFGFNPDFRRCTALDKTYCKLEECGFHKPKGTECVGCLHEHNKSEEHCGKCPHRKKK